MAQIKKDIRGEKSQSSNINQQNKGLNPNETAAHEQTRTRQAGVHNTSVGNRSNQKHVQEDATGNKSTRDCNKLIYYLTESSCNDIEDRKMADYEEVRNMFNELGLKNIEITKTSRIGKRKDNWHSHPRQLK